MNNATFRPRVAAHAHGRTLSLSIFVTWALISGLPLLSRAAPIQDPGRATAQVRPRFPIRTIPIAPSATIAAPTSGSTVSGTVPIQVDVPDNAGVTSVVISLDGTRVSELTTPPYTYSWDTTASANSRHIIKVVASNAAGISVRTQIGVVANNMDTTPPTVGFISLSDGATVCGPVSVKVSAIHKVGIRSVSLYADGTFLDTATAPPYRFTWDSAAAPRGPHKLRAMVTNTVGNSASAEVNVTVTGSKSGAAPPTIVITSPTSGSTVGRTLTVTVNATDKVGVTKVELYVDGVLAAKSTSAPFTISVSTRKWRSAGHTIYCKAYGAAGKSATSPTLLAKT